MNASIEKRLVIARVLASLVGLAGVTVLGLMGWELFGGFAGIHWLLGCYSLILLIPWLYCGWQRGRWAWENGFQRLPRGLGWRLYGGTILVFISLTILLYSWELWRGKWAYAQVKREVESKGDSLALAAVIPPPVADDRNFCATPLLAALTDYIAPPYPIGSRFLQWRQPDLMAHLETLRLPRTNNLPRLATWPRSQQVNLGEWQRCLVGDTHYYLAVSSSDPAKDVLAALRKFDPDLAELHAANQRPEARWAVHYQDGWFAEKDNRYKVLWGISDILNLRAIAALSAGQTDAALQDVRLLWRLADSLRQEPLCYAHFSRLAFLTASLQPVWEGLVTHQWSESQLIVLEARLKQFDLLADWQTSVRGQTYLFMELCRQANDLWSWREMRIRYRAMWHDDTIWAGLAYRIFYPTGWLYQDLVYLYRFSDERLAAAKMTLASPGGADGDADRIEFPVDPFLAIFILPKMRELFRREEYVQTQLMLEEARLACALERYRLAQREYPAALEALLPRFLDQLPRTPNGQQLLLGYRRLAADRFLLYPSGLKDVAETWREDTSRNVPRGRVETGDSVWRFPQDAIR